MKVLLAVDQSRKSSAVTKFVEALRLPARSTVYLLYVEESQAELESPEHFPRMFGQLREELSNIRQKTMDKARQLVTRLAAPFREQGFGVIISWVKLGAAVLHHQFAIDEMTDFF